MKWTNVSVASVMAVASVAALVVACSSTTVNPGTPDSGPVTKTDSGPATGTDSGGGTDGGGSVTCPATTITAADVPTWQAPSAASDGACNAADIAALTSNFNSMTATFTDGYNAISATCRTCVFSNQTDTHWQAIVWAPDMATGMGNAFVNYGACYALVPNGSAACGKGVQDFQDCATAACPSPDCDGSDMGQTCVDSAVMGVCMQYDSEQTTGCGSAQTTLDNTCGDALTAINFMCGTGTLDGGSGSTDSGGG
jgi:hypothetical protein